MTNREHTPEIYRFYHKRPTQLINYLNSRPMEHNNQGSYGYMLEGEKSSLDHLKSLLDVLKNINKRDNPTALEIGPAKGLVFEEILDFCPEIHWDSLDIASYPVSHKVAKTRIIGNAELLCQNSQIGSEYDLIHASWVLPHLIDPVGFIDQVHQKLKIGGVAIITGGHTPINGMQEIINLFNNSQIDFVPVFAFDSDGLKITGVGDVVITKSDSGPMFTNIDYMPIDSNASLTEEYRVGYKPATDSDHKFKPRTKNNYSESLVALMRELLHKTKSVRAITDKDIEDTLAGSRFNWISTWMLKRAARPHIDEFNSAISKQKDTQISKYRKNTASKIRLNN